MKAENSIFNQARKQSQSQGCEEWHTGPTQKEYILSQRRKVRTNWSLKELEPCVKSSKIFLDILNIKILWPLAFNVSLILWRASRTTWSDTTDREKRWAWLKKKKKKKRTLFLLQENNYWVCDKQNNGLAKLSIS